jgi:putative glutamine amidotransferase
MKTPRIAIPEPHSTDLEYNQRSWPQYAHAVESAGGMAVRIPLAASLAEVARMAASCQGVLLPGSGADVDPGKYGETAIPECGTADRAREAVDELLLQNASELRKPLLGICYGFQSLNVWRGGTLVQDLQTLVDHKPGRTVREAHAVRIEEGSRLAALLGTGTVLAVNSSHHQAVKQVGERLTPVAWSAEDGVIEAAEGRGEQLLIGVQWHPERFLDQDAASKGLFRAFIDAAAAWKPELMRESATASVAK